MVMIIFIATIIWWAIKIGLLLLLIGFIAVLFLPTPQKPESRI